MWLSCDLFAFIERMSPPSHQTRGVRKTKNQFIIANGRRQAAAAAAPRVRRQDARARHAKKGCVLCLCLRQSHQTQHHVVRVRTSLRLGRPASLARACAHLEFGPGIASSRPARPVEARRRIFFITVTGFEFRQNPSQKSQSQNILAKIEITEYS